jgi:hypothetical protein
MATTRTKRRRSGWLLLTRAADDAENGRQQQQRGDAALPRLHGFDLDLTNFVACQKRGCGKARAAGQECGVSSASGREPSNLWRPARFSRNPPSAARLTQESYTYAIATHPYADPPWRAALRRSNNPASCRLYISGQSHLPSVLYNKLAIKSVGPTAIFNI